MLWGIGDWCQGLQFFDFQTNLWWGFDEAYKHVEVRYGNSHFHHNPIE
jgi:hypothetical protein